MSGRYFERGSGYDDYASQSSRYHDDRPRHDGYGRPPQRSSYRRSPSPRRRYSPPHDHPTRSDSGELKIKGASNQNGRHVSDLKYDDWSQEDQRRRRSPSPRYTHHSRPFDRVRPSSKSDSPRRARSRSRSRQRSHERSRKRSRDGSWPRQQYRSRSRSHGRRRDRSPYFGGPPSREVILEGLAPDLVEDDISRQLAESYQAKTLEDIRIIRDRHTKASRCFGFVRFNSFEASKAFVEQNYPTIYIYGKTTPQDDGDPGKVKIAYSRERDERSSQVMPGDWRCQNCQFVNFKGRTACHQCQRTYADAANPDWGGKPQYANNGDSDVSPDGTPSQFLIIRGLEPTVTEELLAKGVSKLFKPSAKQPPRSHTSKKGSAKMLSTTGNSNLGAREGTLRRVFLVRDRRSSESWRYGFAEYATVDDAQAALVRYNSFDKFTIASKPVTADYVHAGIFIPVIDANSEDEGFTFSPLSNVTAKLAYWDKEAWANELEVTGSSPGEVNKDEQPGGTEESSATAEKDGMVKKRKAENKEASKQKKATPAHLQFWSDRHAELHGTKRSSRPDPGILVEESENSDHIDAHEIIPTDSFVDFDHHCCWLCLRQLESEAGTSLHERLNKYHRERLNNSEAVSKAKARLLQYEVPARTVPDTWVDLIGKCCYLCDKEFQTVQETSRHENLSEVHRDNLLEDEAINAGKELLGVEHIMLTTAADPYLDPEGRMCYLCMNTFRRREHVFRHAYISQQHRDNLGSESAVKAANARIGKRHKIVPQPLPDSFIDVSGRACYLCQQQFATEDQLLRHESASQIHRRNISSASEVRAANTRIGRHTELDPGPTADTPEYRDRAAERRQAFGTSKKISLAFKKSNDKAEESKPEPDPVPSKGASLLGKMGWAAGAGLGAQGTGMTAPIATDAYVQGVGLGAQGGKVGDAVEEAVRNTKNDYKEFLERTRDKAKERYESMA